MNAVFFRGTVQLKNEKKLLLRYFPHDIIIRRTNVRVFKTDEGVDLMEQLKAYKYRIYPTEEQVVFFNQQV
ncbi:helix-turn-helix domain-containing protein [Candidatus Enterococcus ferrettii]|uniref:helix-turn-helix domain-containing protein n=1 Tax=Candidatus Enterococcus ferrettii TaxID=2815324 RepID=UPI003221E62F